MGYGPGSNWPCCTARLPACLLRVTHDDGGTLRYTGGLARSSFPLGQVSSPVSFYLWRMAAGGGGQDRPEWGRGRRLTQLRGIASGGCLDDSDWKSTIVPTTHAVSEAYRSFKNPTLSWNPAQLLREAGQHSCPACPRPSAHIIMCRSPRPTNRMTGLIAKPAKPLLLVSASSSAEGSAPQRLVVHKPRFPAPVLSAHVYLLALQRRASSGGRELCARLGIE